MLWLHFHCFSSKERSKCVCSSRGHQTRLLFNPTIFCQKIQIQSHTSDLRAVDKLNKTYYSTTWSAFQTLPLLDNMRSNTYRKDKQTIPSFSQAFIRCVHMWPDYWEGCLVTGRQAVLSIFSSKLWGLHSESKRRGGQGGCEQWESPDQFFLLLQNALK